MKIALVSLPVPDPVKAHNIYTQKLGFISKDFNAEGQLAVVASPHEPDGTAILLEPCKGSFLEPYQQAAYEANLPIMVLSCPDVATELARLKQAGIRLRPDLDRPDFGLTNLFEDGCGNLLMLISRD